MQTADLNTIETMENWEGMRAAFPTSSNTGTAAIATVYMTFEPGPELPEHRDSADAWRVFVVGGAYAADRAARPRAGAGLTLLGGAVSGGSPSPPLRSAP